MFKIKSTLLFTIIRFYYKNFFAFKVIKQKLLYKNKLDKKYNHIIKSLKTNGFAKIPNFFTENEIESFRANIVSNLDDLDHKYKNEKSNELIWYENKSKCIKKEYGYSRLFQLKNFNPRIENFIDNKIIQNIASAYYQRDSFPYHSCAQKSMSIDGCGLDWHIDDFLPRFKALVYLQDVGIDDGPFAILKGSHKVFWKKLISIHKMYNENYNAGSIFPDDTLKKINFEEVKCTGKAGDLFLVDVCGVHRGLPIKNGHARYALFNFYSPNRLN